MINLLTFVYCLSSLEYMELDDRNELPTTDHVGLETPCNNAHDPTQLCRKSGKLSVCKQY